MDTHIAFNLQFLAKSILNRDTRATRILTTSDTSNDREARMTILTPYSGL